MVSILDALHKDHANIARLLDALERQLEIFDQAGHPDYDVVEAIVEYLHDYPRLVHHPKEDAVFRRLKRRDPKAAMSVGDQEAEHEILGQLVDNFAAAVRNVLNEREVARGTVDRIGRELLDLYWRHMKMEEALFFPAAAQLLSDEDWAAVEQEVEKQLDPLFGAAREKRFETLRRHIIDWEASDREA